MINSAHNHSAPEQTSFRYRPILIVLFAVILLLVSGKAKADETYDTQKATQANPQSTQANTQSTQANTQSTQANTQSTQATHTIVQLNGTTRLVPKATILPAVMLNNVEDGIQAGPIQAGPIQAGPIQAGPDWNLIARSRPKYAELSAALANFDADADPDGWRASIVLRDANDKPVVMRARATFTLMSRLPTADFHGYVNADRKPITWSKDVRFDADGIAHFKLPLRQTLQPMLVYARGTQPNGLYRSRSTLSRYGNRRTAWRSQQLSGVATRSYLGMSNVGELRVRLSVPTEGVFEAAVPIQIRPSVLVDTHWPYR